MKTISKHLSCPAAIALVVLLLPACSTSQSQVAAPTPAPSVPLAASTTVNQQTPVPSPVATVPANAFQKAVEKATGATSLAQAALTPEDWSLVIAQYQQALDFLKVVPRSDPNYATARKLLTSYQQELTRARQQSKRSLRPTATTARNDGDTVGVIPFLASAEGDKAVGVLNDLLQRQTEFFTKQKRFAMSPSELGSTLPTNNPNYQFNMSGEGQRVVSTAIAQKPGLTSYSAAVYSLKEGNNDVTLSGVCASKQPSQAPPATPLLQGKEVVCPAGTTKV